MTQTTDTETAGGPLRLFVISTEIPVPPIHGGRVDQWNRFRLFRRHGLRLMLASWYLAELGVPTPADRATLSEVFESAHLFPIARSVAAMLRRLRDLAWHSPHVSTRILRGDAYRQVLAAARDFAPDAVWLDGLHGAVTARTLAGALDVPLFYRSHNIEFVYRRAQADRTSRLRDRLAWRLAGLGLERLEVAVQRDSRIVFDISAQDVAYWRSRGVRHNQWLPSLVAEPPSPALGSGPKPWDLVYLGNLSTPNNLQGLDWFLREVLPLLRRERPGLRVRIAGSRPSEAFRQRLAASGGVDLCEDPPDAQAILAEGRVLINPVFSGSGLNVKSVEMLFHDAPIVSTPVGVAGLPEELRGAFLIADTPEEFARACLEGLDRPFVVSPARLEARRRLGPAGIADAIAAMEAAVPRFARGRTDVGS